MPPFVVIWLKHSGAVVFPGVLHGDSAERDGVGHHDRSYVRLVLHNGETAVGLGTWKIVNTMCNSILQRRAHK